VKYNASIKRIDSFEASIKIIHSFEASIKRVDSFEASIKRIECIDVLAYVTPSVTRTPTQTHTSSFTPSHTISPTNTATVTHSSTQTPSRTTSATFTPTTTNANTATPSLTNTPTHSSTHTPTPSKTHTPSETLTQTPTETITASASSSLTPTPSETHTSTPSKTTTPSETLTQTATPSETVTPSSTLTETPTPTKTLTPSASLTLTPTPSETHTSTPTETVTPSINLTATATPSETHTSTPTETITASASSSLTPTPSETHTSTPSKTTTPSETLTQTATPSETHTSTPTETVTPSETLTPSAKLTVTPTQSKPVWAPSQESSLMAHWDAGQNVNHTNSSVNWIAASNDPTNTGLRLNSNGAINYTTLVGGYKAMGFDDPKSGSDKEYLISSNRNWGVTDGNLIIVGYVNIHSVNHERDAIWSILDTDSANQDVHLRAGHNSQFRGAIEVEGLGTTGNTHLFTGGYNYVTQNWIIHTTIINFTNKQIISRINGMQRVVVSNYITKIDMNQAQFMLQCNRTNNRILDGMMTQTMMFNSSDLAVAEKAEGYLYHYYFSSSSNRADLPSTHPYRTSAP
jgi:hypothetical protein